MTYLYTSDDGLLRTNDLAAVTRWNEGLLSNARSGLSWADRLRAVDVVLAHPDDGWVDRKADGTGTFSLSWYPLFCDLAIGEARVGQLVAFGKPPEVNRWDSQGQHYQPRREYDQHRGYRNRYATPESANHGYRVARIVEVLEDRWSGILGIRVLRLAYEDTGIRYPDAEPKPLAACLPWLAGVCGRNRWDR